MSFSTRLLAQLERDEGYRQFPYTDTAGHLTVGMGRNLDAKGLSRPEAQYLLSNDLEDAIEALARRWPWTGTLAEPRLGVLVALCFNLGPGGLAGFLKMWAALKDGDFDRAAAEMLDSQWARQVGDRARRLAQQMRTGVWPGEGE